ncbi:AAA family ATPase [Campylobacter helveticus]|uniref:VirB4 family type IV secretion/conjugal transfer ATPase n=1 Tax=Campylobacter helveticus TaxID=28898 RepID=UPI00214A45ED|nr:AAA family ATPase [Campylobacter helveticus]
MSLNLTFLKRLSKKEKPDKNVNKNIENKKEKKQDNLQLAIDILNTNLKKTEGILKSTQPRIYSMSEESNIACKFDENILCTKDGNLCLAFRLEGYSYAASNEDEELKLAMMRNQFFLRLKDDIELNIICKKEMIEISNDSSTVKNIYAKELIEKWDNRQNAFKTIHYLIFSTKNKSITGFFEKLKDKSTSEQIEKNEKEQNKIKFELKLKKLEELKQNLYNDLAPYKPKILNSDELLNLFASYANNNHTKLKYSFDLLSDCYLSSQVEFKKDYIEFYRNDNVKLYSRFLSVKAYETEGISSLISTSLLRENTEFIIFVHCEALGKEKAIKKVKDTLLVTQDFIKDSLQELIQLLKSDRESLMLVSYSIFVSAESLEELNEKTGIIKGLLENQSLNVAKETLNQKPLFFSFFPSRGNLNARVRTLQAKNLSTLVTFENDILGFKKNTWGNSPVTILKHLSGSPFLFNFHNHEEEGALGHSIVIGGTEAGKTTLMQFLMLNLFRYDINIFAMDKLRGMHNFANYLGCEYHDLNEGENNQLEGFKLNPFSLENTKENNLFLNAWLCKMANITPDKDHEFADIVSKTIMSLRNIEKENINTFRNFYEVLRLPNEDEIKPRFKNFLGSIFDNEEDALNFDKQLSILNMDAILKNEKLAGLSALYLFHKIKNISKNNAKGFFIFIDELKDYLLDDTMRENILEAILEVRKINGVVTMGVQDVDFFKEIPKSNSFINNMANFIIFPTTQQRSLESMEEVLNLTGAELDFLRKTPPQARKILFKQNTLNQSAILDVNLARLGEHLRVFSSNASDVKLLKELRNNYPQEWRTRYIKKLKD